MISVLSPAKSLSFDLEERSQRVEPTRPSFGKDTDQLIRSLRGYSVKKVQDLMSLSRDLAELNQSRYRAHVLDKEIAAGESPEVEKAAIFAFKGDTYRDMLLDERSDEELHKIQDNVRILSGLYGLLRPFDAMQPYRLEMGTRLKTRRGTNLYQFWGDKITKALNELLAERETEYLVNCASNEYFKAVNKKKLKAQVITPTFYDVKDGNERTVSFFAKRARGMMALFVATEGVSSPEGLARFDLGGYIYDPDRSTELAPVYSRTQPKPAS